MIYKRGWINIYLTSFVTTSSILLPYLFVLFEGFREGVFPGVFLLSRWRRSGFPVEIAIRFGPGFNPIIDALVLYITI